MASGFGCTRRFNAAMRKVYHRTPTQIRAIARQTSVEPDNQYLFRLRYRPPYNWDGMLGFLGPRATPGVEVVEHGRYRRSIALKGKQGYFEVSLDKGHDTLAVRVQFEDPGSLFLIIERIRAMFDLNADWASIVPILESDPLLAERVEMEPGLRVPGCWNGFELATRAILGQQVSVKAATNLAGRIARAFGQPFSGNGGLSHLFPTAKVLAEANVASIGMPKARAETIRTLARAVCDGHIRFEGCVDAPALVARLCEIAGIGNWTAQYVAMRALMEPDAFPSGDLGLLHATELGSWRELERRSENWRPWRAYAAMYLWNIASDSRAREGRPGAAESEMALPDAESSHSVGVQSLESAAGRGIS
jgi:AraC family transcriptional regulator of adaptative response / DNA-3-methyladenine glycosylase II